MLRGKLVSAVEVFPNLARFAPAVNPRPLTPPEAVQDQPPDQHRSLLQHLYSDLGVLVYAGANVSQVKSISKLLSRIIREGGSQQLAKPTKSGFDRSTVFKLSTGEHHLDKDFRTEVRRWQKMCDVCGAVC